MLGKKSKRDFVGFLTFLLDLFSPVNAFVWHAVLRHRSSGGEHVVTACSFCAEFTKNKLNNPELKFVS